MKRFDAVVVALMLIGLPGIASAMDLTGALGLDGEFDSNVNRSSVDPRPDFILRLSPKIQLLEDEGKLHYNVTYRMPWEYAVDDKRVDGLRYYLAAGSEYNLNDRTRFTLNDRFSYSDNIGTSSFSSTGQAPEVNTFRSPVTRNSLNLGIDHNFTPRLRSSASLNWRLFNTDLENRADSNVYGVNLSTRYMLSPRHEIGGGVSGTYMDFDRSNDGTRPPQQTIFANIFGSWTWFIDETTTFAISAGPTFIDTDQNAPPPQLSGQPATFYANTGGNTLLVNDRTTCDPIPSSPGLYQIPSDVTCGGWWVVDETGYFDQDPNTPVVPFSPAESALVAQDLDAIRNTLTMSTDPTPPPDGALLYNGTPASLSDQSWTIFAEVSLTKRWTPNLISTASYTRRDSTASGISGSAVLDLVNFMTTWRISDYWDAGLRADWTQRHSTGPVQQAFIIADDGTQNGRPTFVSPFFMARADQLAYQNSFGSQLYNQSVDTTRWGVSTRLTRRLTRHLSTSIRYTFNRQQSAKDSAGGFSDFNDHLVTLNIQYDFDRYDLW